MSNQPLMSDQAFEIRCPACNSVVPAEARGCPTCATTPAHKFAPARSQPETAANGSAPATATPELGKLPLKDYHRLVRDNHRYLGEGRRAPGSFRKQIVALLPGVVLILALLAGAAKTLGLL
jgi:hypothetical protein